MYVHVALNKLSVKLLKHARIQLVILGKQNINSFINVVVNDIL